MGENGRFSECCMQIDRDKYQHMHDRLFLTWAHSTRTPQKYTVKPFLYSRALNFASELNKTAKLKGVNIDTVPTLIGITHELELCRLNLRHHNNFACKIANC